jgi:nitrate/nitrite transporter NarK
VVGGPISGALLNLDGVRGLAGWQWLFLLEGLPAVACGLAVLLWLTERPREARWLTAAERTWLERRMAADEEARAAGDHSTLGHALASRRVWLLALTYFAIVVAFYGVSFWLPQIVRNMSGASDFLVGCISAVPYLAAAVVMTLVASHSDRTGERRWHVAAPALAGAAGLVLASTTTQPGPALIMLSLAAGGIWGALGPFWTLPTAFLTRDAAAGGIALINSIGNLGGFVGPYAIGLVRERTANFSLALAVVAIAPVVAAVLALRLPHAEPVSRNPADAVAVSRSMASD